LIVLGLDLVINILNRWVFEHLVGKVLESLFRRGIILKVIKHGEVDNVGRFDHLVLKQMNAHKETQKNKAHFRLIKFLLNKLSLHFSVLKLSI
jgi:hypothetical protein